MMSVGQARALLRGGLLLSIDRREIGPITQAFADAGGTEVVWLTVRTGDRERLVPAGAAVLDELECTVPHLAAVILNAPHLRSGGQLPTPGQEIELARHFALAPEGPRTAGASSSTPGPKRGAAPDLDVPAGSDASPDRAGARFSRSSTRSAGGWAPAPASGLVRVHVEDDAVARSS